MNPDINAALARIVAQITDYKAAAEYPLRLLDSGVMAQQAFRALVGISADHERYVERINWALQLVELVPEQGAALAELADA